MLFHVEDTKKHLLPPGLERSCTVELQFVTGILTLPFKKNCHRCLIDFCIFLPNFYAFNKVIVLGTIVSKYCTSWVLAATNNCDGLL